MHRKSKSKEVRNIGLFIVALVLFKGFVQWCHLPWLADFFTVIDHFGNSMLQDHLPCPYGRENAPVTVVDISGLRRTQADLKDPKMREAYLDRHDLQDVIEEILNMEKCKPYAIGVDVDFSKDSSGANPIYSEDFVKWCQNVHIDGPNNQPIRIVLGVFRTTLEKPQEWLWGETNKDLAGTIAAPHGDKEKFIDNTFYPLSIHSEDSSEPIPSLGVKLGTCLPGAPLIATTGIWNRLFPAVHEMDWSKGGSKHAVSADMITINSALLPSIRTIDGCTHEILSFNRHKLKECIVLLGLNARDSNEDQFTLLLASGEPVNGIMLHACAALTRGLRLIRRPSEVGGLVLDLLSASLVLICAIVATRYKPAVNAIHTSHLKYTWLFSLVVIPFCAWLLARQFALLWTDYWYVMIALILHSPIQNSFSHSHSG